MTLLRAGLALLTLLSPCARPASAQRVHASRDDNCAVCHGRENLAFQDSIHRRGGLSCRDCHGGVAGPLDVAEAHGAELRALDDPRAAVESCGTCHSDVERMRAFGLRTDQLSLYWTSQHGQKLAADGDLEVATCTTCHGAHGVLAARSPLAPTSPLNQVETCGKCHADAARMAPHGVSSDTVGSFRSSVHGRALIEEGSSAAPTCSDCHGSHGATPPRFDSIEQVCGHCHSTVDTFFAESAHATSPTATVPCTACHSSHDVQPPSPEMFRGDAPGHCGSCHAEGDAGLVVANRLFDDLAALDTTIRDAAEAVRQAGGRGLFLGDERGYLTEARGLLVRARAMTHALSPEALDEVLNRGNGMVAQTLEGLATKRRIFRDRKIYTSIFLGISLAFALVLWMYGAELRNRGRRPGTGAPR